jgi:hypothetical protein
MDANDSVIVGGIVAVITAMITAVGGYVGGQRHGKAAFITAVSDAAELVITRLTKEVERVEIARIRCEEGHEECKRDLAEVRAEVREHIATLMKHNVATYEPEDLKRVGPK